MQDHENSRLSGLVESSSRLEEEIQSVLAVRRIEEACSRTGDVPETLDAVLSVVLDEVGGQNCALMFVDRERQELVLIAVKGCEAPLVDHLLSGSSRLRLPVEGGHAGKAVLSARPVVVPDLAAANGGGVAGLFPSVASGSLLCVPLMHEASPVGVIAVHHPRPAAFGGREERVLEGIGVRLAGLLHQAGLLAEWRRVEAAIEEEVSRATEAQRYLARTLQDEINERRRVEAGLRERERVLQELNTTLEELMRHLPGGVCVLDEGGQPILANPLAKEHLKAVSGQTTGAPWRIETVLASSGDGLPREVVVDGPPRRTYEVAARRIEQGVLKGKWVALIQDVTQEREATDQLRQQDRLAAVGELAAGIAHDFNNLLTSIIGYAQLMLVRGAASQEIKDGLTIISRQGERAAQMIRQILDFSRKSIVERHPVALGSFAKESVRLLERLLPENIRVTFDPGPQDLVILADVTQIQQVLTNLVLNARDAMPDGGDLRIGLSSSRRPDLGPAGQNWVLLTVSDTGTGMSKEVAARIFEPFFTTKPPGKGTGLGLAQVFGIVKQHGGDIKVATEEGKGAAFTIYLPRMSREDTIVAPSGAALRKGRGETILVVEDDPVVLEVARASLAALNYRVLTAPNGLRALEVCDESELKIDLVLTDIVMPVMGGRELCDALRARNPAVKVAVMTGYPLGEPSAGFPEGIAGVIEKPLDLERLAVGIFEALAGGH